MGKLGGNLKILLILLVLLAGCANIKEGIKGFAGVSTKVIEDNRKSAVVKTFNYGYDICYTKALKVLKRMGTYKYAEDKDKKLVAVYVSSEDTTVVGVFFKELDADNTQLEVSSPSTYARELIATRLFTSLEKSLQGEEEEEETDGKKEDKKG